MIEIYLNAAKGKLTAPSYINDAVALMLTPPVRLIDGPNASIVFNSEVIVPLSSILFIVEE